MVRKLLFLTLIISLVVLAGCAKQTVVQEKAAPSDSTEGAIQEAEIVSEEIEDAETEEELDDIEVVLSDW